MSNFDDDDVVPSAGATGDGRDRRSDSDGSDAIDNDPWASPADSAFNDPVQLIEEDRGADDVGDSLEGAAQGGVPQGAIERKPNMAILVAAGVLGLGLLGGVGYLAYDQFMGKTAAPQMAEVPMPVEAPASVVDVFASTVPASDAASGAEPAGAVASEVEALVASASSPVVVAASSSAPSSPAVGAATAAGGVAAAAAGGSVKSTGAAPVPAAQPAKAATEPCECATKPAPVAHKKKPIKVASGKPKAINKSRSTRRAAAKAPGDGVSQQAPAAAVADAREEIVMDSGLRVVAIYPPSGEKPVAWLRTASGRTVSVVVGDELFGSQVRDIDPQKLAVFLRDGRAINEGGPFRPSRAAVEADASTDKVGKSTKVTAKADASK